MALKVSFSDIKSKNRKKDVVGARKICIGIIRDNFYLSLKQIGCFFDQQDHATILYSIRCYKELITHEKGFISKLNNIIETINHI